MTEPLVVQPPKPADACVIWLHGLGADRNDFAPVAHAAQRSLLSTRFVLAQAPVRAVTINGGYLMPSWYDILAMSPERAINEDQLEQSSDHVLALIEQQIELGIAPERIVLAGFSQGGAVVYHAGVLRCSHNLAGVLALSTYAPTFEPVMALQPNKAQLPVLVMHGRADEVVPVAMGRAAYEKLRANGVAADWKDYLMGHEVIPEQVQQIIDWLHERLSA